jgi:hypothetical protein
MTIDTQASIRRGLPCAPWPAGHPRAGLGIALATCRAKAGSPSWDSARRPRSAHRRGRWPVPCGRRSASTPTPGCRQRSAPPASVASGRVGRRTLSTCKRTQAARMASFTWTTGTASPRRLGPFPQPVEADVGPVGHGGGDQGVQSRGNDLSMGSAHACQAPSGSQASSTATHWPSGSGETRPRASWGRVARSASRWRKSSRAGLATFGVCSSSRAQPAGAAYFQKEKEGSPRRIDCPLFQRVAGLSKLAVCWCPHRSGTRARQRHRQ